MTAHIMGGLVYDLDDGLIGVEFSRSSFDGSLQQRLVLGEGNDKLSVSLTTTTVEGVDDLIEALTRIRDDKIRQTVIEHLPEVA
jgi:hypothetical protein